MGKPQLQMIGVAAIGLIGIVGTIMALTEPPQPGGLATATAATPTSGTTKLAATDSDGTSQTLGSATTGTQSTPAGLDPTTPVASDTKPPPPPPPVTAATVVPPGAYFSDKAKRLLPAVVNISTSSTLKADPTALEIPLRPGRQPRSPSKYQAQPQSQIQAQSQLQAQSGPQSKSLPGDNAASPFDEFFKDFMDKRGGSGADAAGPAKPQKSIALGSGFIIDPDGFIVTNNHVVADADEITVILQDDTHLKADLLGRDPLTDLALLKVRSPRKLPSVNWGDSDKMRVGDWVLAVGNPFGLGGTLTAGLLSGRARTINNGGPYDEFLQTDASINRGNSGGPLFNLQGQVVGINSAIFSPSGGSIGLGFAIPSDLAQGVIKQLREGGKVRRGWLGLRIADADRDMAKALGADKDKAVLVGAVVPHSPASTAGLRPGDLITAINGKDAKNPPHLLRLIGDTAPGTDITIGIIRRSKDQTIEAKLSEAEDDPVPRGGSDDDTPAPAAPAPENTKILGFEVAPATPDLKQKFNLGDNTGIVVTSAPPPVKGAPRSLEAGDGILEGAQKPIQTPTELSALINTARKNGKKTIFLLVERKGDLRYVSLRLDRGIG